MSHSASGIYHAWGLSTHSAFCDGDLATVWHKEGAAPNSQPHGRGGLAKL